MRKICFVLLLCVLGLSLSGCGESSDSSKPAEQAKSTVIRVGIPKAPPALPVLYMIQNRSLGDDVAIEVDVWDEPETLIAMVQGGQHQMFAFPLTVIAKLHNKELPVQLMNVNTWGVTYFVTSDPDLHDWSGLSGKTVYVPLQSSPPDALTQFFLSKAGLTVGQDVKIVYASTVEIATMLAAGEIQYATLIEPQVTRALMTNDQLRVAFSFEEEWQKLPGNNSMIPNAGFGATTAFIEENAELAAAFQKAYEEGVRWVNQNPAEAGVLAQNYLELNGTMIAKAVPNMGLYFKSAQVARPELEAFYTLLNNFDPTMIGGSLPKDSMYYHEQ